MFPMTIDVEFDSLCDEVRNEYLKKSLKILKKDVPGALAKEFEFKFFSIDLICENPYIKLNEIAFKYFLENKIILEKLNYYYWIIWTEDVLHSHNQSIGNIATKLDSSTKRKSLEKFKYELLQMSDSNCFYCGESISTSNFQVDHFIPWSFVKNDKLWNLVPSCSKCNRNKSDLIMKEEYLLKLIERNKGELGFSFENNLKYLYNSAIYNGWKVLK